MKTTETNTHLHDDNEIELSTFHVGDLLIGLDIRVVDEINRQVDLTPVPHAPEAVKGVVNLRSEVITAVDLRSILGLPATEVTDSTRNVIVSSDGEQIGLLVDRIGDVVMVRQDEIEPPPANLCGTDARFFSGVCRLENQLLVLLDVEAALSVECAEA